jgi:flavin-dependent dehydrogenase
VVNGVVLKASYSARTAEMAFNGAADRIEKQLRRYTNRLKEHKVDEADSQPFIENAAYTIFAGPPRGDGASEQAGSATIVAEMRVDVPESSVSDAVMLMDLRNTPALMFKNSATGAFNMVYRREDGNIGWVEPHTD